MSYDQKGDIIMFSSILSRVGILLLSVEVHLYFYEIGENLNVTNAVTT